MTMEGVWLLDTDAPGDNLRKRLVRIVEDDSMRWIPGFGRERELDWLRNMEDWMIPRSATGGWRYRSTTAPPAVTSR